MMVDVETVTLFWALLALAADVAVVALVIGLVAGPRLRNLEISTWWARDHALVSAAVVAAVSTAGSLYYSEGAGLVPCELCWYQRIAMYPLVVVLGSAAFGRDGSARLSAGVLASIGLSVSIWHRLLQSWPTLEGDSCGGPVRCGAAYVREFGFVTIPWMAASGFALVLVLLASTVVLGDAAAPSERSGDESLSRSRETLESR